MYMQYLYIYVSGSKWGAPTLLHSWGDFSGHLSFSCSASLENAKPLLCNSTETIIVSPIQ